ncbi:MAG: hypothetical protein V4622_12005 [Bacteroidota bacterium]
MDILLQLALIIVPAGAVFLTVLLFLKKQSEREIRNSQSDSIANKLQAELKKERQKFFLPSRLEAYQRSVLLMERISPNSLVMRLHNPGLPAKALQADLLKAIREEYDHNVAQQLFISPQAWEMVKNSKDETTKIINLAGKQMQATSMGLDLSSKIFEICAEIGQLPTEITIDYLKKELQELF